jgi:hypothetical protein
MLARECRNPNNSITGDDMVSETGTRLKSGTPVAVSKEMGTDHSEKTHQFDVWHMSKSIKKKILAIKPKKLLNDIKP